MSGLYIADGYTCSKTIAAVPGLHGEARVVYRPALNPARREHQRAAMLSAEAYAKADVDLIHKHVISISGETIQGNPAAKDKLTQLKPALFVKLIDLVLSYEPADEESDAKNS